MRKILIFLILFPMAAFAQGTIYPIYWDYYCGPQYRVEVYPEIFTTEIYDAWTHASTGGIPGEIWGTLGTKYFDSEGREHFWPNKAERKGRQINAESRVKNRQIDVTLGIHLKTCIPTLVDISTVLPGRRWLNYPAPTIRSGEFSFLDVRAQRTIPRAEGAAVDRLSNASLKVPPAHITGNIYHVPQFDQSPDIDFTWLPAQFQRKFELTCYVVALESLPFHASSPKNVALPNFPGKLFRASFLEQTRLNGSGKDESGEWVWYNANTRQFQKPRKNCPMTATQTCAEDGRTVAVDPKVIPYGATIDLKLTTIPDNGSLAPLGYRTAEDTGTGIVGEHIDVFFGFRLNECLQWARPFGDVLFLKY